MGETITVGDLDVPPGESQQGVLRGVELNTTTRVDIPVSVTNGDEDGRTILLFASQHGNEMQGTGVVHQVMNEKIDPATLHGCVIAIPVGNPLSFMHHTRDSWIDNGDVGNIPTTHPGGTPSERLANTLWKEAWSQADLVANIHAGDRKESHCYQWIWGDSPVYDTAARMADAIGLTTVIYQQDESPEMPPLIGEGVPPTLRHRAHQNDIAEVTIELRNGKWISEPERSIGVRAVMNVLKEFEMVSGEPVAQDTAVVGSKHTGETGVNRFYGMVYADRGGVLYPKQPTGEFIQEGEVIAKITDLHGNTVETVEMPVDGYIWLYPGGNVYATPARGQSMHTGGTVAYIFTHHDE